MNVQENCIQLKIDAIISDINLNSQDNQNEEKNQITALIGYSHCLDLFDFLQIFSKIQKNELLFQTAVIYDSIGNYEQSMDYINESLILIPNVPSIILFKSGLFASKNKLDESQKWLLKYKYLIGKNKYDNYIHDTFLVILYYLLEYEDFIILRKIDSIENKYFIYVKENIVLFFIKSKILEKLAKKIKGSDKQRYISYIKEVEEIKNKYLNKKKTENEFLFEQGIRSETVTKLLLLINPYLLSYKPKKLIEYQNNFNKNGFSLFYTLIKICKILKLKIEAKKYIKIINQKRRNVGKDNSSNNFEKNSIKINDIIKNIQEYKSNINSYILNEFSDEADVKASLESIKHMCNNIWINGYKKKKSNKNIDINNKNPNNSNINSINYFIREGYYSHLNLKPYILKNIEYNDNFKNNKLVFDSILDDINNDEVKVILDDNILKLNDKNDNNKEKIECKDNINNGNASDMVKKGKKEMKKYESNTNSNQIRKKRIKNSLSDIIKKVITGHQKESHKNKRNKIFNINDNKDSKIFCSTDNFNEKISQKKKIKKKMEKKAETHSLFNKIKDDNLNIEKKEKKQKEEKSIEIDPKIKVIKEDINEDIKNNNYEISKYGNKKEKIKIQNNINSNSNSKNYNKSNKSNKSNKYYNEKSKDKDKEKTIIKEKNKILTSNNSNKKMSSANSNDQVKTLNKNMHNKPIYSKREEKKLGTEAGKYKDVREINLVSYCLKQLTKKKENKSKNIKHKEVANLTDKIELFPHKIFDIEKQILQINEHKFIKSKSKKKKMLNKSIKKQINNFTFEKRMKKNPKNSENNIINNRSSNYNGINYNDNMINLKKTISNYGNKKELSKFKSLKFLNGNLFSNNNYLNINFNNYMNYNFNYSNRHEDKKNFDFRFNLNSDNKKRESFPKEKFSYRTINMDFKNMSTKLKNNKKPLLNSFIDSKEKSKKSSDNKYDFSNMPFNRIKNSPSGETNYLKKKFQNFKLNFISQKTKTSFSKNMLYNICKKTDAFCFSKSINTSNYNKYKNSSTIKSKNMKNIYNKTITNKSNSKIVNK